MAVVLLGVSELTWGSGCTISSTPLQFGVYDSLAQAPLDSVGTVSVNCEPGLAYVVKLGPGENPVNMFHHRMMRSSKTGAMLNYNLYKDSARTEVWGDGTNNTFVQGGAGTGADEIFNVYGRLFGSQNVGSGAYRDAMTVTIEW